MSTALLTGASKGLGRALALELANAGWSLVIDARTYWQLHDVALELADHTQVRAITGDVRDPAHRAEMINAAADLGGLDLLVNNASTLGPTPLPSLADLAGADLLEVYRTNVQAPLELTQAALPMLTASGGVLLNLSSDAAVEHYPGWGAYAAAKAALDHITLTFGVENADIACYAVDPGDLCTEMHQAAFPGEDISDRPDPSTVAPSLLRLVQTRPPSGRYRAAQFAVVGQGAAS